MDDTRKQKCSWNSEESNCHFFGYPGSICIMVDDGGGVQSHQLHDSFKLSLLHILRYFHSDLYEQAKTWDSNEWMQ